MTALQTLHAKVTDNTPMYFRCILFLTFLGHGLVSLGFTHEGYALHQRIFESVNIFGWNAETFLIMLGWWDILLGVGILLGLLPRVFLGAALGYLCTIAIVGFFYYHSRSKDHSWWGIGETARRGAWICYTLFLLIYSTKGEQRFSLLRIGISTAFLAHGFASIGYFGLSRGQIELAAQVLPNTSDLHPPVIGFLTNMLPGLTAEQLIFYSGFSDVALGSLLLFGVFSRVAATIGSFWLITVVILSYMMGFPEGIFRMAFFLSCVYVALDVRCHAPIWANEVVKRGALSPSVA